jgi:CDP-6-deoxy-D-xylo-4-hexulose-3-dehydrase
MYVRRFYDIASYIEKTKSNFAFPLISYRKEVIDEVKKLLSEHNIEYRPIVSGNLLKHPFLNDYSVCSNKKVLNVDIIHDNGIYLGNNQFVNKQHFDLLSKILQELIWKI